MTKKHFVAIAAILRDVHDHGHPATMSTSDYISRKLADVMKMDNPYFDQGRFLEACGVKDD